MTEFSLSTWAVAVATLVLGILVGHFGWGKRWLGLFGRPSNKLHPDYLTGRDYLVSEQPDRALDMFLRLMDANNETVETHFALGALYRRRGEVERAIRIHQNLLARDVLPAEHREQALLALAQDHRRAGLLDRAEDLFQQVSEVPRLRASALDALRGVYELQREWGQALQTYRLLERTRSAPSPSIAAHYLCELAMAAMEKHDSDAAGRLLREARREVLPFPRAMLLRSQIAESQGRKKFAIRLLRNALHESPKLLLEELPHLLDLVGQAGRDAVLAEMVAYARSGGAGELKRVVFAAMAAGLADAPPLRAPIEEVFAGDPLLNAVGRKGGGAQRIAGDIGTLIAHAERYRCNECGFAGRSFYWHCPACHAWDSFEAYALVTLR